MIKWHNNSDGEKVAPTRDGKITYKEDFERVFGERDSYDALMSTKNEYWIPVFDKWKEKGILN